MNSSKVLISILVIFNFCIISNVFATDKILFCDYLKSNFPDIDTSKTNRFIILDYNQCRGCLNQIINDNYKRYPQTVVILMCYRKNISPEYIDIPNVLIDGSYNFKKLNISSFTNTYVNIKDSIVIEQFDAN